MIRHKDATIQEFTSMSGDIKIRFVDIYECENCGNRQFPFNELAKEQCNACGHNNHKEYMKFLKEQTQMRML